MIFFRCKGIDNAVTESFILQIPNLQAPEISTFVPLLEPLADMKIGSAMSAIVMLCQTVEEVEVAFQLFKQRQQTGCCSWLACPKIFQIGLGIFVDKEG